MMWVLSWWKECPYGVNDFVLNFTHIKVHSGKSVAWLATWIVPSEGLLKFNVYGSTRESSDQSVIGGALLDSHGM